MKSALTSERLRELLRYDPATGVWTWLAFSGGNCPRPGEPAGTVLPGGYRRIRIDGTGYLSGPLVFLYMTGEWPVGVARRRDGDRGNDRWENFRPATRSQSTASAKRMKHNKSGFKGVSWDKLHGRWRADVTRHGRHRFLGHFDAPEVAHEAYRVAARELFGEFARTA